MVLYLAKSLLTLRKPFPHRLNQMPEHISRLQKHSSIVKPRQRNAPPGRSMMKKIFRVLLATALLASFVIPTLADTIKLKDGSVIRGQVIGFKDQQFTILIGGNARGRRGQTTVYVEDVESIEFDSTAGPSSSMSDDGNNPIRNDNSSARNESTARNNPPPVPRTIRSEPAPEP